MVILQPLNPQHFLSTPSSPVYVGLFSTLSSYLEAPCSILTKAPDFQSHDYVTHINLATRYIGKEDLMLT